jgi:hypothetical protein
VGGCARATTNRNDFSPAFFLLELPHFFLKKKLLVVFSTSNCLLDQHTQKFFCLLFFFPLKKKLCPYFSFFEGVYQGKASKNTRYKKKFFFLWNFSKSTAIYEKDEKHPIRFIFVRNFSKSPTCLIGTL